MGLEAYCRVQYNGQQSMGRAQLEEKHLVFRGEFRLKIAFRDLLSLEAQNGRLHVCFSGGTAVFELGAAAEKWALKVKTPRSLLEKLGVRENQEVSVVGIRDENFWSQLRQKPVRISEERPKPGSDLIFFLAEQRDDLKRVEELSQYLEKRGALWLIWPKRQQHIPKADVRAAGKKAGLVDIKVVAFSETHSGLKFVIPVSRRR